MLKHTRRAMLKVAALATMASATIASMLGGNACTTESAGDDDDGYGYGYGYGYGS